MNNTKLSKEMQEQILTMVNTSNKNHQKWIEKENLELLEIDTESSEVAEFLAENNILVYDYFLKKDREKELVIAAQSGDKKAAEELCKIMIPSVLFIARKFSKGYNNEDCQADAMLYLVEAIHKYDTNSSCRLSTYVYHHVRQQLIKSCRQDSAIVIKSRTGDKIYKVEQYAKQYHVDFWSDNTYLECAKELGFSIEAIKKYVHYITYLQNVDSLDNFAANPDKLEKEASNSNQNSAFNQIEDGMLLEQVNKLIDFLPETDQLVFRHTYGFTESGEPTMLKDICNITGLSAHMVNIRKKEIIDYIRSQLGVEAIA